MTPGKFITLEGGEGVGKSTQARLLAGHLRDRGHEVIVTREPGGSALAERIRDMLLDADTPTHSQLAEALLFNAARADHLDAIVRPALARGAWVICDRFIDSTRVYQGSVGGIAADVLATLDRLVVAPTWPDLTIVVDLDPAVGLARVAGRRAADAPVDRYEARGADYHARLRAGFLAIARAEPQRCAIVDGALDIDSLAAAIRASVASRLPNGGP